MSNNQLLASDNFASGSLAAGWSAWPTLSTGQVVNVPPHVTEANALSTTAGQVWTGLTWPNDQISEITINAFNAADASVGINLGVRIAGVNPSDQGYVAVISASSGSLAVYFRVGGSATQIGSTVTGLTFAAGDVVALSAKGSSISVFQNFHRIFFFYDATYLTGGSPGFAQNAATSLANNQVSSWRGYSAVQQDGIWQKQGVLLPALTADLSGNPLGNGIQCPSIIFDGNAQILSGNVYKVWLATGWSSTTAASIYYAESTDGISWTRRGAAVLAGYTNNTVFKSGSTYYMICQAVAGNGSGTFQIFTSTDGISWALQSPSQTISLGGGGTWDHNAIYPGNLAAIIGGTFYVLYLGFNGTTWATGIITSTDGINWVKSGSNPVLNGALPQTVMKIGSTYYGWFQQNQPGQGNGLLDPIETYRYSSPDLITWTKSAKSVHHSQLFEDVNDVNGYCIPAGGTIFDIGGKAYLFLNSGMGDANAPQIGQMSLAIGPATIAQIIGQPEDAAQQIATDSFQRADGSLGANWTTSPTAVAMQIASHLAEPSATDPSVASSIYTGASFGNDQYSEITIHALTGTLAQSILAASVRASQSTFTQYEGRIYSPSGTSDAAATIWKRSGGVSQLGPSATITPQVGDVFRLQVVTGNDGFPTLSLYQNGFLILQVQDTSTTPITTGNPGILGYSVLAIADAQISAWAGGNANVIPTYQATVASPTFNPGSGTYRANLVVQLNGNFGSTIYYTTDGTTPTTSSPSVQAGQTIVLSASATVKAYAVQAGFNDSGVVSAVYTITPQNLQTLASGLGAICCFE